MTRTATSDPTASPTRGRLVGAATAVVAVTLTVLFWPIGLLVAGLFGIAASVWCRHWTRLTRVAVLIVATCVASGTALVLADFSVGTTIVR